MPQLNRSGDGDDNGDGIGLGVAAGCAPAQRKRASRRRCTSVARCPNGRGTFIHGSQILSPCRHCSGRARAAPEGPPNRLTRLQLGHLSVCRFAATDGLLSVHPFESNLVTAFHFYRRNFCRVLSSSQYSSTEWRTVGA
jgi:hypothetical protein